MQHPFALIHSPRWIRITAFVLMSGIMGILPSTAQAAVYQLDPAHTDIGFSVQHLNVSRVRGSFRDVSGVIVYDPQNPQDMSIQVTIKTSSIDTGNTKRDEHLRSPDFFDAAQFPEIRFESTKIEPLGEGVFNVTGRLTIKGVTKEISFPLAVHGPVQSPFGTTVIGLSGQTKLDRRDFNITWNKALDQGGWLIGNDVDVSFSAEAALKPDQ